MLDYYVIVVDVVVDVVVVVSVIEKSGVYSRCE